MSNPINGEIIRLISNIAISRIECLNCDIKISNNCFYCSLDCANRYVRKRIIEKILYANGVLQ